MSRSISESDWKLFRQLRVLALERFCQRVLDEVAQVAADSRSTTHDRYLKIFEVLQKRDRTIGDLFDAPRRSVANTQLLSICSRGLLTDEEIARFSPETRDLISRFSMDRE